MLVVYGIRNVFLIFFFLLELPNLFVQNVYFSFSRGMGTRTKAVVENIVSGNSENICVTYYSLKHILQTSY